jgi:hypothetical protein
MNAAGTVCIEGGFSCGGAHIVLCDGEGFLSVYGSGPAPNCLKVGQ